jgi:hypothetical protein
LSRSNKIYARNISRTSTASIPAARSTAKRRLKIARSFNCGLCAKTTSSPAGTAEPSAVIFLPPRWGLKLFLTAIPQLKLRAIFGCASGAAGAGQQDECGVSFPRLRELVCRALADAAPLASGSV